MEMIFELGPIYRVTYEDGKTLNFKLIGGKDLTYEITDENNKVEIAKASQWMNGFIKIEKVTGTQC